MDTATNPSPLICILGASLETTNMGVSALAVGSLKSALHCFPDCRPFLLEYNTHPNRYAVEIDGRQITVLSLDIRFSKKLYLKNNIAILIATVLLLKLVPIASLKRWIISRNPWLQHLYKVDIAAAISGGDSFSDIYGVRRFLYVALPQLLFLLMGKKLVLLPQTIGPFQGSLSRRVTKFILKRAACVYSRDQIGVAAVEALLGPGVSSQKAKFCYDVAFALDPLRPAMLGVEGFDPLVTDRRPIVGLNVSGLLYMGGYNRNNAFQLKSDYRALIHQVIAYFIEVKQASVLLIPHVFGDDPHSESDAPVCRQLYKELALRYGSKIGLADGRYNQSEIKYIVGLCDFFAGSRMHACIGAVSQCVPAVSLAYSQKFIGVMQTVGIPEMVADLRQLDVDGALQALDQAYEKRAEIRRRLSDTIPDVKATVLQLFNDARAAVALHAQASA
jgi:colanic acid/amylovoran biosynthesis protein